MVDASLILILWLIGISLSTICLLVQILLYIHVPSCRKLDLKILTHITAARMVNAAVECLLIQVPMTGTCLIVALTVYVHTDCVMICWMFVFSKNLYDKLVQVFTSKKMTFALTSVLVWALPLPVGVLCPTLLSINQEYFDTFYKVYAILKFVVLSVNLLFFCRIFYVAIKRSISVNFRGTLRICVILFVLVSISSIQVFFTDLVSYFEEQSLEYAFFMINSYQVLIVMTVFIILVRASVQKSKSKVKNSDKSNGGSTTV